VRSEVARHHESYPEERDLELGILLFRVLEMSVLFVNGYDSVLDGDTHGQIQLRCSGYRRMQRDIIH
jgi:hypothetical protein